MGWPLESESDGGEQLEPVDFGSRIRTEEVLANLGRAADQDDDDIYAAIWNPAD